MSSNEAEKVYLKEIHEIFMKAKAFGISNQQFDIIFKSSITDLQKHHPKNGSKWKYIRLSLILLLFFLILFLVNFLLDDKPLNLFLCKIQEFIYPGLKLLRILSIPIISMFPSLTELYDETCLIQNPFFRVADLDCLPCRNIHNVLEISNADEYFTPDTMPPFIHKTNQKRVEFKDLKNIYMKNRKIFNENAPKIIINNTNSIRIEEFFNKFDKNIPNTFTWRLNRMSPAILIRTLFPRPDVIPKLGQSTERFIMIDNPRSVSYELPEPECNFVFIIQSAGERYFTLRPTNECIDECETISVLLTESYLLWYNWWYWRPISHQSNTETTSISYIGSYC